MNSKILRVIRILTFFIILTETASAQGLNFETNKSWDQVKEQAKMENKYIFLDFYATWCGPCKWMDEAVYAEKTVGAYFNDNFISVKLQIDTSKNDNSETVSWYKNANELKILFDIKAVPTQVFLDANAQTLNKLEGARSAQELVSEAKNVVESNNQYAKLLKQYHNGGTDAPTTMKLVELANKAGQKAFSRKIAIDYINSLTLDDMYLYENVLFTFDNTKSSADRGFSFFFENEKKIQQLNPSLPERLIEGKIIDVIVEEFIKPFEKSKNGMADWVAINTNIAKFGIFGRNAVKQRQPFIVFDDQIMPLLLKNPTWNTIKSQIQSKRLGQYEELLFGLTNIHYLNSVNSGNQRDITNLVSALNYYLRKYESKLNGNILNGWAWLGFERFVDIKNLLIASKWAKKAVAISPDVPQINDTYANLLYRLGDIKNALIWQAKAVKLAPDNLEILSNYEKMLAQKPTWNIVN